MKEHAKTLMDVGAAGVSAASILGWIPAIAGIFTLVWTAIRIYETETVQKWLGNR